MEKKLIVSPSPHIHGAMTTRRLMKDVVMLDKLYEMNLNYHKELSMYIIAGKKKLQQERAKKPSMSSPAEYFKAPAPKDQSFEDMMTRFKSISDDKMSDLKRGKDFKRRSSRKGK